MRNFESRIGRLEQSIGGGIVAWSLTIKLHTGELLCVIEWRRPGIERQPYSLT